MVATECVWMPARALHAGQCMSDASAQVDWCTEQLPDNIFLIHKWLGMSQSHEEVTAKMTHKTLSTTARTTGPSGQLRLARP